MILKCQGSLTNRKLYSKRQPDVQILTPYPLTKTLMHIFDENKDPHFPKWVQLLLTHTKVLFCILAELLEIVTLPVYFILLARLLQRIVENQSTKTSSSVLLSYSTEIARVQKTPVISRDWEKVETSLTFFQARKIDL